MLPDPHFDHTWSDAWLLLAAALTEEGGSGTLPGLLAAADAIQHAVPTFDEVDGAIGRLCAAGLLKREGNSFRMTPAGHELSARAAGEAKTLGDRERVLGRLIGATAWAPTYRPADSARSSDVPQQVSVSEYEAATRGYTGR